MTADRKIRGITAWLLAGAVLALTAAFLVSPRQTFSENENRWLAEFPAFDRESLFSGQYMTDIGTYLSDHFPFRVLRRRRNWRRAAARSRESISRTTGI